MSNYINGTIALGAVYSGMAALAENLGTEVVAAIGIGLSIIGLAGSFYWDRERQPPPSFQQRTYTDQTIQPVITLSEVADENGSIAKQGPSDDALQDTCCPIPQTNSSSVENGTHLTQLPLSSPLSLPAPTQPHSSTLAQRVNAVKDLALVVGVWSPGQPNKFHTLALDHDSSQSSLVHALNPNYRPDFIGDFMQIPNEKIGLHQYTRIIFQGVCPVATAIGATPCSADSEYHGIHSRELAQKVRELISDEGGHVFFRHCGESAHPGGIGNIAKRREFIGVFESQGFELQKQFFAPLLLTRPHPGEHIPDPCPIVPDKWEEKNGGMIFFLPKTSGT